jgi:hypothetical protein
VTLPRWLEKSGCGLALVVYVIAAVVGIRSSGGPVAFLMPALMLIGIGCAFAGLAPLFRSLRDHRKLVAALEARLGFRPLGGLSRTAYARLEGTHASGRAGSVTVLKNASGGMSDAVIGLALGHAPAFVVRRTGLAATLVNWDQRRIRGRTGDRSFDGAFAVELPGEKTVAVGLLLDVREAIEAVFRFPAVDRIEVQEGALAVVGSVADLAVEDCARLLDLLARIAPALDRVSLNVRVLGGLKKALALSGSPRCAYCHGDVTGFEPDLVACASCSTVLHEGCWAELGRCPVLGCTGASPERARAH